MKPRKINIPLSTANKKKFSTWILDNVEIWPKFQAGIINQLQEDRYSQRKQSDETFEETKPPEGMSFTILGIRLFEVFFLEDFASLERGLLDLLDGQWNNFIAERIKNDFPNIKQSIWFGDYHNIGFLCRPKQFFGGNVARRMELPEEVDYISISFQKSLPSMITVSFDIFLNPNVIHKIQNIQRKKYLPDFHIEAISFPPLFATTHSFSSDHAQMEAVQSALEEIRIRVEKLIVPFLKGYFYKTAITRSKLPAIEIYSLSTENNVYDDFESFSEKNRFWFSSMGFQTFFRAFANNFMVFYENEYIFEKPTKISSNSAPYKFILFEKPVMDWLGMNDDKDPQRILLYYNRYLDKLALPLALLAIQKEEQEKVEKIREKTSTAFTKKRLLRRIDTTFNDLYQVQSVLRSVERINFDFEHVKKSLTRELTREEREEPICFSPNSQSKERQKLSTYLLSVIEFNNKILLDHVAFLDKYFSRHVELSNIKSIYHLQVITVALTIGAFILGIISVIAGWESILKFASMVTHFLDRIFGF